MAVCRFRFYSIIGLFILLQVNCLAVTVTPDFYATRVQTEAMVQLEVSDVSGWVGGDNFSVLGTQSGDLSSKYSPTYDGVTFTLSTVLDSITYLVAPGDHIRVTINPDITNGEAFSWEFFTAGDGLGDSDSTLFLSNVHDPYNEQAGFAGEIKGSLVVDMNNDHRADLLVVSGEQIDVFTEICSQSYK